MSSDPTTPHPGERRHPGPRPQATGRDLAWAALAAGIAVVTVLQVIALGAALLQAEVEPTLGRLLLAFVITVVWWLTIYWLVLGAWRRSVWGCPFPHAGDDGFDGIMRCPRHGDAARRPRNRDDDAPARN